MITPEEKASAKARGIGMTKAYIVVKEEDNTVGISLTDYFEGEEVDIKAETILEDGTAGAVLSLTGDTACTGKAQGISTNLCHQYYTCPLATSSVRVTITYLSEAKTVDVSLENKSAILEW